MKFRWKGKKRQHLGLYIGILVLTGIPISIIVRAEYVEKLNWRLLSAVRSNDTGTVIDLLARGADAHVQDVPQRNVSLWQRFREMLHLQQKPPSNGPSALRLALEWRPKSGSSIKPSIDETALIRTLISHGARLDGPEVMARMERTYAFCSTYQDTGHVRMPDPRYALSFRTAFIRPNRLYFEYMQIPQERHILWENDLGVFFGEPSQHSTEETTLDVGIGGMAGVSLGTSSIVPYLLYSEQLSGSTSGSNGYPDAQLVGIKTIDGVSCYEIVPVGTDMAKLYIDTKTFLMRKVIRNSSNGTGAVIVYHPAINMPISQSTFQVHVDK